MTCHSRFTLPIEPTWAMRLTLCASWGVPFTGLHLVTWGEVDPQSDTIAMWLGFPAASLAKLGLRGLPREAVLPIAVRGSLRKPSVDWRECAPAHVMRTLAMPIS